MVLLDNIHRRDMSLSVMGLGHELKLLPINISVHQDRISGKSTTLAHWPQEHLASVMLQQCERNGRISAGASSPASALPTRTTTAGSGTPRARLLGPGRAG